MAYEDVKNHKATIVLFRRMRMGVLVSTRKVRAEYKASRKTSPVPFPISAYDKYLLKTSWNMLSEKQLEFGTELFYRLFRLKPELISKFTEFEKLTDIEELRSWPELKGHPKKLSYAFNLAIESIDDGHVFIDKIESLGTKHLDKLKNEDMQAMGKAILQTIHILLPPEQRTQDVERAWESLYGYISKLFRDSIEQAEKRMAADNTRTDLQ